MRSGESVPNTPYPSQRPAVRGRRSRTRVYDSIVIGGGPAGLSAAVYLARYNRSVVVVDAGEGRSTSHETNENYLGFPNGIRSRQLRSRSTRQAVRFGAEIVEARATSATNQRDGFTVRCGRRTFRSRTLILATGVIDRFPKIAEVERYVGVTLFWCITCDGWKTRAKRVVVVGDDDDAATTALQLLDFTEEITVLTNSANGTGISAPKQRQLAGAGITLVPDAIARVQGRGGRMRTVETRGGALIPLDMMFNQQGCDPNVELAKSLRVKLDGGYIVTDNEQRTNIERLYAAGDVTKAFAHQIVTAAHEGATAAQAANYDLYRPEQRA